MGQKLTADIDAMTQGCKYTTFNQVVDVNPVKALLH